MDMNLPLSVQSQTFMDPDRIATVYMYSSAGHPFPVHSSPAPENARESAATWPVSGTTPAFAPYRFQQGLAHLPVI